MQRNSNDYIASRFDMIDTEEASPTPDSTTFKNWRTVKLSQLCYEDKQPVVPGSEEAVRLPYLGLEHIEAVTGRIRKEFDQRERDVQSTSFRFDARHILYSKLRPYLNKVALPEFEGRCTTELIPLLPFKGVSREYLACLLRRPQTVAAAMQEKTGTRMPRADIRHILSLTVLIPVQLEEQISLAHTMSQRIELAYKAKEALQDQIRLLDAYIEKSLENFPQYSNSVKDELHG